MAPAGADERSGAAPRSATRGAYCVRSSLLRRVRELEGLRAPTPAAIRDLYDMALTMALAGLSRRGRLLTKRWLAKQPFSLELRLADAIFSLYDHAPKGAEMLRRLSGRQLDVAGMRVIAAVVRGDLSEAVVASRAAGWFLEDARHADVFVHVIWALAHTGRLVEATALLDQWRRSFPDAPPEALSTVLRAGAWLEATQLRLPRAARLLEEARAAAPTPSIQRCFAEADLAYVYSALGRTSEADEIRARWGDEEPASPIKSYRHLSRAAAASLRGDFDEAFRLAAAVRKPAERSGNLSVAVHARFWESLSAPAPAFAKSFAGFRSAVAGLQSVLYGGRLRVMDAAGEGGTRPLRGCTLVERSAHGTRPLPFARLWAPDAEAQAADLYYDAIQRRLFVRGAGPTELDLDGVLSRALEVLFSAPDFSVSVDAFYEEVWGLPFHRLRHSTKLHVTVHRLRSMLQTEDPAPSEWVRVRGGRIGFAPELDVRVLGYETGNASRSSSADVGARVIDLLKAAGPLGAPQIAAEVGLGTTSTRSLLARLVGEGKIVRSGVARATRYAAASGSESAGSRKST